MKYRYLAITLLLAACPTLLAQTPVIESVLNNVSFDGRLSLGVQARVEGQNLSAAPAEFCNGPIPWQTSVSPCNAMVLINGEPAPVRNNSATRIQFQIPFDVSAKGAPAPIEIIVDVAGVRSEPVMVELLRFAPTIFDGYRDATVVLGQFVRSGQAILLDNRAMPGDTLTVVATGLGPTDPPVLPGFRGTGEALVAQPKVRIHGTMGAVIEAEVLSAVALGGYDPGVFGVEFVLPVDLPVPLGPDSLLGVELVIEDQGEVFTSPMQDLPVETGTPPITEPVITRVSNAYSLGDELSPGAVANLGGQNLSASPDQSQNCNASGDPQPTVIPPCNAMVLVNDVPAPLIFSANTDISF